MKKKSSKRLKVNNQRRFVVSMSILAISVSLIGAGAIKSYAKPQYDETMSVQVTKGQTLWGLAEEYSDSKTDIRDLINDIMEINNLNNSYIQEGQVLSIPVQN